MLITAVLKRNRKNTAVSGKLIKAIYGSYVYVYMLCVR